MSDPYYKLWAEADGVELPKVKIRSQYSVNLSIATKAAHARPEVKANHKAGLKRALNEPATRAKHLAGVRRAMSKDTTKEAIRTAQVTRLKDPTELEKHREAMKKAHASPEGRARMAKVFADPKLRAKVSEKTREAMARPEVKAAMSKALSRPCTVDGITIYPSRLALSKALGRGKAGDRHPNFRFVDE